LITTLTESSEPFGLVIALALASTLISSSAIASAAPEAEEKPSTSTFRIGAIKQIVITQQTSAHEKSLHEPPGCKGFQLTRKDVSHYLRITHATNSHHFHYRVNFSMCSAGGTLALQDGRTGAWMINRGRGGIVTLSDGTEFFLYCKKCSGKKYYF
jgi:hypothetical protein